ncbi:DUF6431 domain-containing protein [Alicyclobacillus cycloheptanicus]|uniref:DUF6431 domain-containing protein n=1 Tax=Alicyclobacillus cycloheptanicus TaxID=1457 RepID=UPI003898E081
MSQFYTIPFPNVESYLRFCEDPALDRVRPPSCDRCGHIVLHGHGSYVRSVWAEEKSWRIQVFRFRCANPDCRRTCSVLPSFVGRYERFVWDVQELVCTMRMMSNPWRKQRRSFLYWPQSQPRQKGWVKMK